MPPRHRRIRSRAATRNDVRQFSQAVRAPVRADPTQERPTAQWHAALDQNRKCRSRRAREEYD